MGVAGEELELTRQEKKERKTKTKNPPNNKTTSDPIHAHTRPDTYWMCDVNDGQVTNREPANPAPLLTSVPRGGRGGGR